MVIEQKTARKKLFALGAAACCLFAAQTLLPAPVQAEVPTLLGSGNSNDSDTGSRAASQYSILNQAGTRNVRFNMYPGGFDDPPTLTPKTGNLDSMVQQAYQNNVTPLLLFDYYYSTNPSFPAGTYSQWYTIGQTMATRYAPNSPWLLSQGISNFGITYYQAFNEPDINSPLFPSQQYHDALQGLADGVHSVSRSLRVTAGGYADPCDFPDFRLNGYGPAIADLLNNGTLDGIDLHNYADQGAILAGRSAQNNFSTVKAQSGVTRDVNYYTTEFNYQRLTGNQSGNDAYSAQSFLTMLWDNLGVVGNSGTPVCQLAMAWQMIDNPTSGDGQYALSLQLSPWIPDARGVVFQSVAQMTAGMNFVSLDPQNTGEFELRGAGKTLWVWQDRPNWTNHAGTSYTVAGIPPDATQLRVYNSTGQIQANTLSGQSSFLVTGLPGNETYMFLVDSATPAASVSVFQSGFEASDPAPTWRDAADYDYWNPSSNPSSILGYVSTVAPECSIRGAGDQPGVTPHGGAGMLMAAGTAVGNPMEYSYSKVFDLGSAPVAIQPSSTISYWINPYNALGRYVGVDFHCTDGTNLRDSGLKDQNGASLHPNAGHGGGIPLNQWTQITASLAPLAGKYVDRVWVAYDNPASSGQYRAYLDDLVLDPPAGSSLSVRSTGGTASASSNPVAGEAASSAFDRNTATKWLGVMASPAWLQYQFPSGNKYAVSQYQITSANDVPGRDPRSWNLCGSSDGRTWITLDTKSGQTFAGRFTTNTYSIRNGSPYKYYRLNVTQNNGSTESGAGLLQLSELKLLSH